MNNSDLRTGFMAVFAVSGSVVLLAHQFHKRLLSDFMKRMEFELGFDKNQTKKRVRFSDEVVEVSSGNKPNLFKPSSKEMTITIKSHNDNKKCRKTMPLNWKIMYKGIIEYRNSIFLE